MVKIAPVQTYTPGKKNKFGQILPAVGTIAGAVGGAIIGGPGGAAAGASLGASLGGAAGSIGGQILGKNDTAGSSVQSPLINTNDNPMARRLAQSQGDHFSQLKQAAMALPNVPEDVRQTSVEPIMTALYESAWQKRTSGGA